MAVTLYKIDKLIYSLENSQTNKSKKNKITNFLQTETKETEMNDLQENKLNNLNDPNNDPITIGTIKNKINQFVIDRDWMQYHTPRNLLLALIGEIGELSEIFQWRGECKPGLPSFNNNDKIHLGEEMADVLIYLCRLADVCNINLTHAVNDKMKKNAKKYPAKLVKGSAKKYTHYTKIIKDQTNDK